MAQQITHPLPTEVHWGFQYGWVFADTRSPQWTDVQTLFLTPLPAGQKAKERNWEGFGISDQSKWLADEYYCL